MVVAVGVFLALCVDLSGLCWLLPVGSPDFVLQLFLDGVGAVGFPGYVFQV